MIKKLICEPGSEENFEMLSQDKKDLYIDFYNKANLSSEGYILAVDIARPDSKDYSCVIKYDEDEYKKGNIVVKEILYL